MLLQFTVKNFKSFKKEVVLSLEPSVDKEHPENYSVIGKDKCLNVISIFGANASGKSNLFAALTAAILLVRRSNTRQIGEPLLEIVPYKFDPESIVAPSSFEFVFYAEGTKYVYGFSATRQAIIREYLYSYLTSKPSLIFERTDTDTYRFTSQAIKKELSPVTQRNAPNKLFLATATAWNCEATKNPFLWIGAGINTYSTDFDHLIRQTPIMYENDSDGTLRHFTNQLLKEADINIDDYRFKTEEVSKEQFLGQFPPELWNLLSTIPAEKNKRIKIDTIHSITRNGQTTQHLLDFEEESQGTKNLFLFSPVLKRAFETGETLCIDEFDSSLHPLLVKYLVSLFNDPIVNKAGAQLIVSSHAMVLMSLSIFRRDQIFFIEKDKDEGISDLYSLDEFSPRKNEDVRKAYLIGRYGSIPNIVQEAELWQ